MARPLLKHPGMNFATRLVIASSLVAAAGTAALAQPGAEPAPQPAPVAQPAPQNTDWNAVSHINGQLVPVGEKNDYYYDFKRTIISADPVGWIVGMYGISGSYAITDHVALRGELDYYADPDHTDNHFTEVDVSAPIYFKRTYQGAFLEPGLVVRTFNRTDHDVVYDANGGSRGVDTERSVSQIGPQVLVGWHWTWESGLNVAAAVGVGRNVNETSSSDRYIPNGYLRFGYAF